MTPSLGVGEAAAGNVYRDCLEALQAAGIRHALLRDSPEGIEGLRDLDLLVDPTRRDDALHLLTGLGFQVREFPPIPHKSQLFRYDEGRLLTIDLHWKLVQDGLVYLDERRVLERRAEAGGSSVLSTEDLLLHLVFHVVLARAPLKAPRLERIRALLGVQLDPESLRASLAPFGTEPLFREAVSLLREPGVTREALFPVRRRMLRTLLRFPGNRASYLRRRWSSFRRRRRRGGVIALVGPDGSGKSTVARAIEERCRQSRAVKVARAYLGPWGQCRLRLVRFLRKRGFSPSKAPWRRAILERLSRRARGGAPARLLPGVGLRGLLWGWLKAMARGSAFYPAIYCDLLYRYWKEVRPRVRRGAWVVADRYITDLRFLYKSEPAENNGLLRFLACKLYPKPDLFVFLDNRPEVIAARKDQLSLEKIAQVGAGILRAIAPYRHEVIATERPPPAIADRIVRRMLELQGAGRRGGERARSSAGSFARGGEADV